MVHTAEQAELRTLREKQQLSAVYEMPDLAEPGTLLSAAETEFFMTKGFLVKHGLLDESRMAAALDQIWSHLLTHVPMRRDTDWVLEREDKSTWMNPQWVEMPPHPASGPFQGRHPIEHYGRIVKLHDLGGASFLLDLLPNRPQVRAVAQALLGDPIRPSEQTRGVYATFPTRNPKDPQGKRRLRGSSLVPHTDEVCQQLNACAYLDDVPPRSGGFTVYPGSHKLMFQAHEYEANWSPRPTYHDVVRQIVDTIEPYELVAKRGAVIFWHGRLLHSVGIHISNTIRWAVFADFTHDREVLSDDEHRRLGQYEWFKDAKLFSHDHPVSDDMWRGWRVGNRW